MKRWLEFTDVSEGTDMLSQNVGNWLPIYAA